MKIRNLKLNFLQKARRKSQANELDQFRLELEDKEK